MSWWQRMRALFGNHHPPCEGAAAVVAAGKSHRRAVSERDEMAALRAEADVLAAQVRAHNAANRYDDFLRRVMGGGV